MEATQGCSFLSVFIIRFALATASPPASRASPGVWRPGLDRELQAEREACSDRNHQFVPPPWNDIKLSPLQAAQRLFNHEIGRHPEALGNRVPRYSHCV